jgi:hypothetical protein
MPLVQLSPLALEIDRRELTNRVTTSWLFRTFGEGCRNAYMIRAVMQLSHFWGYRSNHFFTSMG